MTTQFRRPWLYSERPVPRRVVRPLEQFLRQEIGSASLLMAAAVAALLWANVAPGSYERFWGNTVTVGAGGLALAGDARHVVNDLLMAVFFFVVSLEVKRELLHGALRDRRSAIVPAAAAFGTMVGAAATYLAVNASGGDLRGWAIPIATDIAFALGVLGLVGSRAPRQLRPFMLTLAVVDDLATIVVIAVFFTTGLSVAWLAAAAGFAAAIVWFRSAGVRSLVPYVVLAGGIWVCVLESGVHATIAGVVVGFLTPAGAFYPGSEAGGAIGAGLSRAASAGELNERALLRASRATGEAVSPLVRMEQRLHPWSAFAVLPVFALANAGVPVSLDDLADALSGQIGLGIFLGLVVGAPAGGLFFAWAIVRLGPGRMPRGLDWPAISGVAPLKGIGFTVAIFISALAFDEQALQDEAKLAILVASLAAAGIGLTVLRARARLVSRRR